MTARTRLLLLILIMAVGTLTVAGSAIIILHGVAVTEEREELQDMVRSEARLIEAVTWTGPVSSVHMGGRDAAAMIAKIVEAHRAYDAFGKTGEFLLARREGDRIVYLLRHRSVRVETPSPEDFNSELAEPMRRALEGRSGSMIGVDYRGAKVLAAYEPVRVMNLGMVAEIDLAEVRAPFVRAGLLTVGITLFVVFAGAALFVRVTNPMIEGLKDHSSRLEGMVGALRESEERYRSTFDGAPVGVAQVAPEDGRFRRVNRYLCEMLHFEESELLGLRYGDVDVQEDEDGDLAAIVGSLQGERPSYAVERQWRRKDGSTVWVTVNASPVQDGSAHGYLVLVVKDISQRKRAEEVLKRSLREKEVLLREIHHRVKNNMQVVSSLLNLQARGIGDPKSREVFEESQSRVRAMALIHEVLYSSGDLSRIDLPRYLRALAVSLGEMYGGDSDRIRVKVDVEDIGLGLDETVPCGLVIHELLANSYKYAFPNGRGGEIDIEGTQDPDGRVRLVVRDDGVGMPPEVDLATAGTMGLQLVKGLIENQLGGDVEVERDGGTCFRFSFPVDEQTWEDG
ncbi:MAG: PAS domain S-box protein [Gemmatimonadetes bacterium]|nr:PAS domain S-box protein [Gemmatimonadota bacterium]